LNCPNCSKEILDEKAVYCPYCAKLLIPRAQVPTAIRQSNAPIAGGILTIIAAFTSFMMVVIGMVLTQSEVRTDIYLSYFLVVFGISGYAFGLIGGIFSLQKKNHVLSLIGTNVVYISGLAMMTAAGTYIAFFWIGLLMSVFSVLGLFFTGLSKSEFA
jgi:hypothetical protein